MSYYSFSFIFGYNYIYICKWWKHIETLFFNQLAFNVFRIMDPRDPPHVTIFPHANQMTDSSTDFSRAWWFLRVKSDTHPHQTADTNRKYKESSFRSVLKNTCPECAHALPVGLNWREQISFAWLKAGRVTNGTTIFSTAINKTSVWYQLQRFRLKDLILRLTQGSWMRNPGRCSHDSPGIHGKIPRIGAFYHQVMIIKQL